jgi:2-polyprenyl-3-methyl-5-hydroxy-6-metoxy-1,4-benzoquinol methylase
MNPALDDSTAEAPDAAAKYDAAYAVQKDFVPRPNRFLAECLARIAPPRQSDALRALDVGMGQGRNAIFLAQQGFHTTGIDRSEVGVGVARRRAAELGVSICAEVADGASYDFGREVWDLIALLYYSKPIELIDRVKAAIKTGGHIVIERFSQKEDGPPLEVAEGRLTNPMLGHFLDWHVLHYQHDVFESDWHWSGESPTGMIVRLLARKP